MTAKKAPEVHVGVRTQKGSALQAQLSEAPACVFFGTEDMLCQVTVAPSQDRHGVEATIDDKPRRVLPDKQENI